MSGVFVGTKLERLLQLRAKLDLEISLEQKRVGLECGRIRPPAPPAPPVVMHSVEELERLGLLSITVKRWAKDQGLIPEVRRGRVNQRLVEAYAQARTSGGPVGHTATTHGAR